MTTRDERLRRCVLDDGKLSPRRARGILQGWCSRGCCRKDKISCLRESRAAPPLHARTPIGRDVHLLRRLIRFIQNEAITLQIYADT